MPGTGVRRAIRLERDDLIPLRHELLEARMSSYSPASFTPQATTWSFTPKAPAQYSHAPEIRSFTAVYSP